MVTINFCYTADWLEGEAHNIMNAIANPRTFTIISGKVASINVGVWKVVVFEEI